MKKYKKSLSIIILFTTIILISSCSDSKRRNIIGIWEIVPLTERNDTVRWSFFDGNQVIIEASYAEPDTAEYIITSNVLEYYINCDGFNRPENPDQINASSDGKYLIDFLDTQHLKLQRISNGDGSTDGTFRYLEFKRSL